MRAQSLIQEAPQIRLVRIHVEEMGSTIQIRQENSKQNAVD